MIVYSKKIVQFIQEIKKTAKRILSQEVGVKVAGDRFFNFQGTTSYPLVLVIFNNRGCLGYFNSDFYEMGFHECLMHATREQLHDIIRHEIGHYFTYIQHGSLWRPHGNEFRDFCRQCGWSEKVYLSTVCIEGASNASKKEENSVLRKIQKLLALSTSSNAHEAEQAMIKSQQLLLKHNIDAHSLENDDTDKVFLKRILQQKKETAKMRAIGKILETFFVNTVYRRAGEYTYLEIVGSAINLEIAEYVANFLEQEFDKLWDETRKDHFYLKGMVAKNSFFEGIAKGYCLKIDALKREYSSDTSRSLMVIENQLSEAKAMVYPRLHTVSRSANSCRYSSLVGEQIGRQLSINPALNKSSKNLGLLIC